MLFRSPQNPKTPLGLNNKLMIGRIKKVGNDLLFHAITHQNIHDVVALLEDNEVDVNCKNINGQTPLHYAVNAEARSVVEVLLQFDANPNL